MLSFREGITLGELRPRLAGMDLAKVVGDTPVLVFRPVPGAGGDEPLIFQTPPKGQEVRHTFLTDTAAGVIEGPEQNPAFASPEAVVVPVVKSNRNPETDDEVVTIGRSRTNDIRVTSKGVSKHHASLELSEWKGQPAWRITDHGSANGTFVNGLRLDPGKPHFLRPSDELQLGDVISVFVDAEGLVSLCEALHDEH